MGNDSDFLSDWASTSGTEANDSDDTSSESGGDFLEQGDGDEGEASKVDNGADGNDGEADATTADDDHDENGQVPYAAMKAERAKRQAERERAERAEARQRELQAEIEALRNPVARPAQPAVATSDESAQPPDFWVDPQAYVEQQLSQRVAAAVQEVQLQSHFRTLEDRQRAQHADFNEVSTLAHQAASRDPELARRILMAEDPGAELYAVGKQIKDYQLLTSDPDAFRAKMREEILAELGGESGDDTATPDPAPRTRRTVDLSTRRNAKAESSAAPPDPFNALFPE